MSASAKSRTVYPSGTDSPGKSQTKGRKMVVVVPVVVVVDAVLLCLVRMTWLPVLYYFNDICLMKQYVLIMCCSNVCG